MELPQFFWDLQYRWPLMFRLKGTVILRIWWQIIFVVFYTSAVVCLHLYVPILRMDFPLTLIPVLGVVIGLLLVFRTNTAYDRYWEGRRLWSCMTQNIRTLTRCIWVGVREVGTTKEIIEKTSVINLLIAFAYATKNYLREEYSYDCDGIRELISHIPRFSTPSSNQPYDQQKQQQQVNQQQPPPQQVTINVITDPAQDPEKTGIILLPKKLSSRKTSTFKREEISERTLKRKLRQLSFTAHDCVTPTNIPIELSYYIASYIYAIRSRDLTDPSTMLIMNHALNNLVDCLTGFERILRTPIPLAYSVHLHHSIWLYLLSLPYQIVNQLGWWAVPAVVLASFALLGILGIGWEIENPFGYDDNDLPLDDFCKVIHKEIQTIVGHKIPPIDEWILSNHNHPLAPTSMESALELSTKPVEELRQKLANRAATKTITLDT